MNKNRNTLLFCQSLLLVFFYVTSINSSLAAKAKAPLAGAKSKPYYESPKSAITFYSFAIHPNLAEHL